MNLAVRTIAPSTPSKQDLMARALDPHILLGMPHLTPMGLSETWLMKELGHRHWLMLAARRGMEDADFRTASGEEAYAAICATSLQNATFERAGANDVLTIRSVMHAVSRTQMASVHHLSVDGAGIGEVELVSTFVRRGQAGDNRSIVRVDLPGQRLPPSFQASDLATAAAAIRNGKLDYYCGLPLAAGKAMRAFRFSPDPTQEFNGAGLFYFAEFQAIVDRALAAWSGDKGTACPVERRDVIFLGNIRAGESVTVELASMNDAARSASCLIRRDDGAVIARIVVVLRDKLVLSAERSHP